MTTVMDSSFRLSPDLRYTNLTHLKQHIPLLQCTVHKLFSFQGHFKKSLHIFAIVKILQLSFIGMKITNS